VNKANIWGKLPLRCGFLQHAVDTDTVIVYPRAFSIQYEYYV